MADPILYSYWRSSCSYRVRIAAFLKKVAFEYRDVHLVRDGGEQKKADYLALNPMGQVPLRVQDGHQVGQSMAIIQLLEQLAPQPALFPADPFERAQVVALCEDINTGIQPVQNLSVMQYVDQQYEVGGEGKAAWASHWIDKGFVALEAKLAKTAGVYAFGDQVSAVDCFLVPQVYNAVRFKLDMDRFPTIKRVNETCLAEEAFKQAHPDSQPDAP